MHEIVIANTTPIIALLGIGKINILKALYNEIIIPHAVSEEILIKNENILDDYNWIRVHNVTNLAAKEVFSSALHIGEIEVILLSKEMRANLVIIDDNIARRHAKYLGLTVTGTIGIILRAKREGIIHEVKPVINKLIENGFYISNTICEEVLNYAGES